MEPATDLDSDQILEWHRRRCWCGIYTRQSRESQTEFSSCEAQFDACFAFVQSQFDESWLWNGERYDDEGQSSETLDRPALKRLLEDVRAGKVQRVLVHRLDRLSRRMADGAAVLQQLRDCGAELTVVTQPELTGSAADTLVLNVMSAFAAFEQEMIRERLADARAAHKRRGRRVAGITPYGYKAHPETKQLVVVEQEARRVRKMFRMAAAGRTPREIAHIANHRVYLTKMHARGWTLRHVLAVLSNPVSL